MQDDGISLCNGNETASFGKNTTLEKQTLDIHKPIAEKGTSRKSFNCDICKMEFVSKSILKGHVFEVHGKKNRRLKSHRMYCKL